MNKKSNTSTIITSQMGACDNDVIAPSYHLQYIEIYKECNISKRCADMTRKLRIYLLVQDDIDLILQ